MAATCIHMQAPTIFRVCFCQAVSSTFRQVYSVCVVFFLYKFHKIDEVHGYSALQIQQQQHTHTHIQTQERRLKHFWNESPVF